VRVRWLIALAAAWLLVTPAPSSSADQDSSPIELKLKIPGVRAVQLTPVPDAPSGGFRYRVETDEGTLTLSPEEFTRLLYDQHNDRPFWKAFLNITNPIGIAWVALGLLGQVLFAGRMVVQWLTSERRGRSVVPVTFWWMSLVGASMLLAYFVWRKDVVGVLGQSTGWLIYARNLHLIYTRGDVEAEQSSPEPAQT
jgi:lipid-A-disaccharide synthase-like uncharacterized protein